MKNLVKSLLVLTILFTASSSFAQVQRRSPEERANNQTQWMVKNLSITADQSKQAHDIILHHAQQAEVKWGANNNMSKQDMDAEKQAISAELKPVLTSDQLIKYEAHMQQMEDKQMQRAQQKSAK